MNLAGLTYHMDRARVKIKVKIIHGLIYNLSLFILDRQGLNLYSG
jgi:hypothetical protein